MNGSRNRCRPLFFCGLVIFSILLFYTAYDKKVKSLQFPTLIEVLLVKDHGHTLSELNKVAALAGIGLLSFALALGLLGRIAPFDMEECSCWRQPVAVTGLALILMHSLCSVVFQYPVLIKMLVEEHKTGGVIAGGVSLALFLMVSARSASGGVSGRKIVPALVYWALILGVMHFMIMETRPGGRIEVRPYGWVFFYLPCVVLFLKSAVTLFERIKRTDH